MEKEALKALVIMAPERREKLMGQLESFGVEAISTASRGESSQSF